MRKRLMNLTGASFFLAFCLPAALMGQSREQSTQATGVNLQPMLRNILLEEFTGLHCSYCPSGHANAQALHNVLGHRMQTIAIHVGSLATPSGNEVDLRSPYGEAWYQRQGGTGMPTGAVNRHHFDGLCPENEYSLSWSYWQAAARMAMNDTAIVNLYAESSYDTVSRQLSARVELYFPVQATDSLYTLTVALTENYIRGTQTGGNAGDQYLHKHVLRDLFTDTWGDTLKRPEAQTVIEKSYTLEVPAQYNNRAPVPANFEVIAFVSNPQGEILNSTACHVMFEERYIAPSANISVPGLSKHFSRTSIPVRVENLGTDTLRSICLNVSWGDTVYQPTVEDLAIPYGQEQEVWFPLGKYPFEKVLKYRINTLSVNGSPYETRAINDYISEPLTVAEGPVQIKLTTDEFGSEITWTLRNRAGDILLSGGPYEDSEIQEDVIEWEPVQGEVYSFEVEDAFLDGFSGGYAIVDAEGNTVESSSYVDQYGDKVSFVFPFPDVANETIGLMTAGKARINLSNNPALAGTDVSVWLKGFGDGPVQISVFDLSGSIIAQQQIRANDEAAPCWILNTEAMPAGFYFVRATDGSASAVAKLLVR